MARFLAILLLIPVWTHAQLLDPGPEHYEAAVNGIAVSRASAQLLALEAEVAILEAQRQEQLAMAAEARRLRTRLVDVWGAHVRRMSGEQHWPRPGDGWHVVHRRGD